MRSGFSQSALAPGSAELVLAVAERVVLIHSAGEPYIGRVGFADHLVFFLIIVILAKKDGIIVVIFTQRASTLYEIAPLFVSLVVERNLCCALVLGSGGHLHSPFFMALGMVTSPVMLFPSELEAQVW